MLNLSSHQIAQIKDLGYSVEDFLFVYFSFHGDERFILFTPKQSLVYMGKPTKKGFDLLAIGDDSLGRNKVKLDDESKEAFEKLWKLYPVNNGIPGLYESTRLTRGNKENAVKQFRALLQDYGADFIINNTKIYIDSLVKASNTSNQLTYLPHLHNFLAQKKFLEVEESTSLTDKLKPPTISDNDAELL